MRKLIREPLVHFLLIGALLTAALYSSGQYLIGYLIGSNEIANLYDAAGSLLVIMLWVFYASAILFLGASFTFSLAYRR